MGRQSQKQNKPKSQKAKGLAQEFGKWNAGQFKIKSSNGGNENLWVQ